jgi:conjugative transfer region protein TrbK
MRRPSFPALARGFGYIAVAAAVVAAALHFREVPTGGSAIPHDSATDPLAAELQRCRQISMAAKDDPVCEAAWAENRRRFFASPAAVPEKE